MDTIGVHRHQVYTLLYAGQDKEYNQIGILEDGEEDIWDMLIICANHAYKTKSTAALDDELTIIPNSLLRDLFIKRMRQALRDNEYNFTPYGAFWKDRVNRSDAIIAVSELGQSVPITFSFYVNTVSKGKEYVEEKGEILLADFALRDKQFVFQAIADAIASFKS